METTEILKNKFELLIIGKMLSPEEALINLGYKLGSDYDNLCLSIKILNEGWVPDWEDQNQPKYYNYFRMKGGFSYYYVDYFNTNTYVPSALCFKSEDTANLACLLLLKLYEKVYFIKKVFGVKNIDGWEKNELL